MIRLWLDDLRPAPKGWTWVKTVDQAKKVLLGDVSVLHASLDHDLGACQDCNQGLTPEEWLEKHDFQSMPNCEHFGTGYDLLCWMEENDIWPEGAVNAHTANPVGMAKMAVVIEKMEQRRVDKS